MGFRERFNCLFNESGQSQEAFGRRFGATKNQVYNWRRGIGEPGTKMLVAIAVCCGVSLDWLLGASELRKPEGCNQAKLAHLLQGTRGLIALAQENLARYELEEERGEARKTEGNEHEMRAL